MLQPISFNVIRQALEWHDFPVPDLRQLSYSERCEEFIWGEYLARWTHDQLCKAIQDYTADYVPLDLPKFTALLQGCFCSDVEVRHVQWDDVTQTVSCILYVKVFKALTFWASYCDPANA